MLCCGIGGFGCVGVSTGGYGKPENIPGKVINNNSQSRSVDVLFHRTSTSFEGRCSRDDDSRITNGVGVVVVKNNNK